LGKRATLAHSRFIMGKPGGLALQHTFSRWASAPRLPAVASSWASLAGLPYNTPFLVGQARHACPQLLHHGQAWRACPATHLFSLGKRATLARSCFIMGKPGGLALQQGNKKRLDQ
jgi:hypothetical protein